MQRPASLQHAVGDTLVQKQSGFLIAPEPRGVFETSATYWATAPLLMASPPQMHIGLQ